MNEHIEALMDVYLDGELNAQQARQVETHVAMCESCRAALTARRGLSALIRDVPGMQHARTSADFAKDVLAVLDEDFVQDIPWWFELRGMSKEIRAWLLDRRVHQVGWVAVPVILLLASIFIRSVGILNTLLSLVPESGSLVGQVFDFLEPVGALQAEPSWGGALSQMVAFDIGGWTLFTGLFASLLIGFLYAAWIAGWLSRSPEASSVEVME